MAGVFRFFPNFTAALNEIKNARIFGGHSLSHGLR
jgi:hypothetical protein